MRAHCDGRIAALFHGGSFPWEVVAPFDDADERLTEAEVNQPGWHEVVILLPSDADAQRLAEAIFGPAPDGPTPKGLADVRAALHWLAAGTEDSSGD